MLYSVIPPTTLVGIILCQGYDSRNNPPLPLREERQSRVGLGSSQAVE